MKSKIFYGDERLKRLVLHTCAVHQKAARKALDVLRVGLWFENMRSQLNCETAYSVGQVVQPHTYKKGLYHNNLWAKYACGRHLPGSETIRACTMKVPGSEEMFASPAWQALDLTEPLAGRGDALLRSLRPSIQNVIFEGSELAKGLYIRRRRLVVPLRSLEGQADLQSLAATVVLLRDAHESGNRSQAFTIGCSLHRTLLMASALSPLKFISLELFEFFIRYIFPRANEEAFAMDLNRDTLYMQSAWLRRTAMQLHAAGRSGFSLVGHTRQLRRLLDFDFGFDLMYGLKPRLKLMAPAEAVGHDVCSYVTANNVQCDWGATVLGAGQTVRFPPGHIFRQGKA